LTPIKVLFWAQIEVLLTWELGKNAFKQNLIAVIIAVVVVALCNSNISNSSTSVVLLGDVMAGRWICDYRLRVRSSASPFLHNTG